MTAYRRCLACAGSGRIMGGGMMSHDCDDCDGRGKIEVSVKQKAYNKAIQEIKNLDPTINDEKAKEIFDDELKKIERKEKKKLESRL